MSYKQILYPNLDDNPNNPLYVWIGGQIISDWCGWCLAVVAASFGAKGSSYSAKTAWQSNSTQHRDRNLPNKIYVPLWYEGGEYGHVVIGYRDGNNLTIWTSPCGVHQATFQVLKGELNWLLDYTGQIFQVGSFSGWSETLLQSRVIEKIEESKPEPTPEPEPEPEPDPEPEPPTDTNDDEKDNDMTEPAKPIDQQLVNDLINEAGENSEWSPSKTTKLIAYLIGDFCLCAALVTPDAISMVQNADNLTIFGEYLAKVLLETGICILMVFKLIKKK